MTAILQMYLRSAKFSKNTNYGFTIIELLVVIIIIGILSAIALPSFLNQANRARQTEATTYVSTALRGQQAFYLENSVFTPLLSELDAGANFDRADNFYTYTASVTADSALPGVVITATPKTPALSGAAGKVYINPQGNTLSIQCNLSPSRVSDRGPAAATALATAIAPPTVVACPTN